MSKVTYNLNLDFISKTHTISMDYNIIKFKNNFFHLLFMTLDFLFVNPSLNWEEDQKKKISMRVNEDIPNQETPLIGIAYLLSIGKKLGYNVKYIDMVMDSYSLDRLLEYLSENKPPIVGLTGFTVQIKTAAYIAAKIKERFPDIKICVGGVHVTPVPKQTLDEFPIFDFVICGEAELIFQDIIKNINDIKKLSEITGVVTREKNIEGKVLWNYIKNIDDLPFPAWEEFDLTKYPGSYPHRTKLELPMIAGRGCPFQCVFCCKALGSAIRLRSVSSVISEIERNIKDFGCQSISFIDETFTLNKKWTEEFFDEMIKRGLNKKISWSCSTRVNDMTPEFLKRMKAAGCYYIFYGMESADDETLIRIKKNITVEQIKNAVKWTKEAGIVPVGAFIIGLPGDCEKEIMKAIDLGDELDLFSITFPIAVPFPGTALRDMAIKDEYGMRIISHNWDDYGKQDPGVMESEELPWSKRKELQKLAYIRHPKKNYDDYLKNHLPKQQ